MLKDDVIRFYYTSNNQCIAKGVVLDHKKICDFIWWFRKFVLLLSLGEVAEWSIAAVLKTVELRGSGGSNPSLSAAKGVNQVVTRFTPFFTPKN